MYEISLYFRPDRYPATARTSLVVKLAEELSDDHKKVQPYEHTSSCIFTIMTLMLVLIVISTNTRFYSKSWNNSTIRLLVRPILSDRVRGAVKNSCATKSMYQPLYR